MAEEKKPRIDLKARLGKKTVSTPGKSIPPPVGIPKPSGIPVPPFGAPQKAPRVDASDPYSAIDASVAPARAEPQAIKVEMSEEVVAAQKKGRTKIIALALATAVVGGLLGTAVGSGMERGKRQDLALGGADMLAKEVDEANVQIEQLADVLKSAKQKLSENKYPAEEVSKLGGINIPFSGINLTGKGIGLFKSDVVNLLITYAGGATEANDQKEKLQAVLGGSKTAIQEFLNQQEKPQVRWSVYVTNGPYGPWATMNPLGKDAFSVKEEKKKDGKAYSWPASFKIRDGGKTFDLKRYTRGDPMGSEPKIIPVDPSSQAAVCPADVLIRLRREIGSLEETLRGNKTPGQEKDGLLDTGRVLHEKLKQIGGPG